MTTENLSFYNPHSKGIGEITCTSQETAHTSREVLALIRFGPAGDMYLYEPETARELLAAAFAAVQILDPEGADDTLSDLLDAGALNKILRRIAQQEAAEQKAACRWCKVCGVIVTGGEIGPDGVTWLCEDHRDDAAQAPYPGFPERYPSGADSHMTEDGSLPVAAPDTAQPEDIPIPSCADCHADGRSVPLVLREDGAVACNNRQQCEHRQAANAGAVNA